MDVVGPVRKADVSGRFIPPIEEAEIITSPRACLMDHRTQNSAMQAMTTPAR
jgi:hypothetical protein